MYCIFIVQLCLQICLNIYPQSIVGRERTDRIYPLELCTWHGKIGWQRVKTAGKSMLQYCQDYWCHSELTMSTKQLFRTSFQLIVLVGTQGSHKKSHEIEWFSCWELWPKIQATYMGWDFNEWEKGWDGTFSFMLCMGMDVHSRQGISLKLDLSKP